MFIQYAGTEAKKSCREGTGAKTAMQCTIDSLSKHTINEYNISYGVATISRLLKMIGLFCRI